MTDARFAGMDQSQWSLDITPFRAYNRGLYRWLTPDPLAGNIMNPQSLNHYAYVMNNPTNFIDPLGLDTCRDSQGNTFECPSPDVTSVTVTGTASDACNTLASPFIWECPDFFPGTPPVYLSPNAFPRPTYAGTATGPIIGPGPKPKPHASPSVCSDTAIFLNSWDPNFKLGVGMEFPPLSLEIDAASKNLRTGERKAGMDVSILGLGASTGRTVPEHADFASNAGRSDISVNAGPFSYDFLSGEWSFDWGKVLKFGAAVIVGGSASFNQERYDDQHRFCEGKQWQE